MNIVSLTLLGALLVIAGASSQSEYQSSFIASANLEAQNIKSGLTTFGDSDLHSLILHNLGLLSQETSETAKEVVNQYGEPTFTKKTLLNYLFLIDMSNDTNSKDFIPNAPANHHTTKFEVCNGDDTCILEQLHNKNSKSSLASQFESTHGISAHKGIHYYSSDKHTAEKLKDFSFSSSYDRQGNIIIIENRSGRVFPQKQTLKKCINDIVNDTFNVDVDSGIVYSTNPENGLPEGNFNGKKDLFRAFAEEMCSVVTMSKLIRKDSIPGLVSFYISSMGKLQDSLAYDAQRDIIHNIWDISYSTFRSNILKQFNEDEIAGQIVLLNHNNTIANISLNGRRSARMLDDNDDKKTDKLLSRQNIVYRVFGIGFVIVVALILVAMSSIEVQKDTLVYSKFLTAEPRR